MPRKSTHENERMRHTANRSNSGNPQTAKAVGNPERSLQKKERATTRPIGRRLQAAGSRNGRHPLTWDGDIVWSAWKHAAASAGKELAILVEHNGIWRLWSIFGCIYY